MRFVACEEIDGMKFLTVLCRRWYPPFRLIERTAVAYNGDWRWEDNGQYISTAGALSAMWQAGQARKAQWKTLPASDKPYR